MLFIRIIIAVLATALTPIAAFAAPPQPIILIHGAWGGGQGWWKVKPLLEKAGHRVFAPSLPGQGDRASEGGPDVGLTTHIDAIVRLIESQRLNHVILVGHSYGGMVITGVADRIPERIARLVYVDAFLPENGESAFDLMNANFVGSLRKRATDSGNTWGIPASDGKGPPQPIRTLDEKLKLTNPNAATIAGSYILTVEPGMTADAFVPAAQRAQAKIWPISILRTGHLPQVTMSEELARLLIQAALASSD